MYKGLQGKVKISVSDIKLRDSYCKAEKYADFDGTARVLKVVQCLV